MEIQSAVSPLGSPLSIPDPFPRAESLSPGAERSQDMGLSPAPTLQEGEKDLEALRKKREQEESRKRQEQMVALSAREEKEEERTRENRFRLLSAQALPEVARVLRNREQQGNPMDNIEESKQMMSFLLDGGISAGLEGALTSGAEEEGRESPSSPDSQPEPAADPLHLNVPRR